MKRIIHYVRGSVHLEVEGAFLERFLNICGQNEISFWDLEWRSETCFRLRMYRKDYKRLLPFVERVMCTVTVLKQEGAPFFLGRFRKRYALLIGLAICLMVAGVLSRFILSIEVTGNETVSTEVILNELSRLGVRIGTYGPSIDATNIRHELLLAIEELSWFTVNITGTRAHVIVRERTMPPEVVDEKIPSNVIATKDGIVTRLEVLAGQEQVEKGSAVLEGELLISGVQTLKGGDGSITGTMVVHAMGNVYARTFYTLTAKTPLVVSAKRYTGEDRVRLALIWGSKRINFYRDGRISFLFYDKITQTKTIPLPGGLQLPVGLQIDRYEAYEKADARVDRTSAEEYLKSQLKARLEAEAQDGAILRMSYTVTEENDMLQVTLLGECEEQIGRVVELPVNQNTLGDETQPQ